MARQNKPPTALGKCGGEKSKADCFRHEVSYRDCHYIPATWRRMWLCTVPPNKSPHLALFALALSAYHRAYFWTVLPRVLFECAALHKHCSQGRAHDRGKCQTPSSRQCYTTASISQLLCGVNNQQSTSQPRALCIKWASPSLGGGA